MTDFWKKKVVESTHTGLEGAPASSAATHTGLEEAPTSTAAPTPSSAKHNIALQNPFRSNLDAAIDDKFHPKVNLIQVRVKSGFLGGPLT